MTTTSCRQTRRIRRLPSASAPTRSLTHADAEPIAHARPLASLQPVLPARSSAAAPVAFFCTEAIDRLESVLSRPRYRRANAASTWSMKASVLLRSAGSATLGRDASSSIRPSSGNRIVSARPEGDEFSIRS